MEVNVVAVIVATVAMFGVGALWYLVLFSKQWAKMHGMDKMTDKEMKEMSAKMGPYYGLQLLMTIVSAWVLAYLMSLLPNVAPMLVAVLVWLGFVLPADVSGVIFGGTNTKDMLPKIAIQAGEALLRLVVAAWIISLF
jgi:hypothetical protein